MKFLLRSTFLASPSDEKEGTFRNHLLLDESGLGFDVPEDESLWTFVREFSRTHNHSPEVRTIRAHFEHLRQNDPLDRLEQIATLKPFYRGDFIKRLEERSEERRSRAVSDLLREASTIITTGLEVKNGRDSKFLRGPRDAVTHLIHAAHDIVAPTTGARLSGEVTGDGQEFMAQYLRVKNDPLAGIGQFTGIQQLDESLKGAKRHELWLHAAFTGGLKSTFGLNWAYNQAVFFRYDVCYFSLEMPYEQCRRILYSIHSMHPRFTEIRVKLGIQKANTQSVGLDYEKIRDGMLSDAEEVFLSEYVVPDFNSEQYGKIHIEVADPDKTDFTVFDMKSKAELIYASAPFAVLYADHAGLFSARKNHKSTTESLNEVLRDLKKVAMNFNRGAGIAVVAFFQISREGYKAAEKIAEKSDGSYANGPYNLTHLSYANEAERSADIVTASYVDSNLRAQSRVLFQCLKTRDTAPFLNFFARVAWNSRRILTSNELPMLTGKADDGKANQQTFNEISEIMK